MCFCCAVIRGGFVLTTEFVRITTSHLCCVSSASLDCGVFTLAAATVWLLPMHGRMVESRSGFLLVLGSANVDESLRGEMMRDDATIGVFNLGVKHRLSSVCKISVWLLHQSILASIDQTPFHL